MGENKGDQLVWYIMVTAMGILVVGGGAWATNINAKVEKIAGMEVNIQYLRNDVSDIKNIITKYIRGEQNGKFGL